MRISEVFGPTLQGEGVSAGRPAAFLRLGGCNLQCSWCDTPYTWDASRFDLRSEITEATTDELARRILAMRVDRLIITGGEPLLQERQLATLVDEISYAVPHIEIETNGTRRVTEAKLADGVERFTVSPKLAHAGQGERAYQSDTLREFQRSGKAVYKFVVNVPDDLTEVDKIVAECGLTDVWLMPQGTTTEAVTQNLGWLCDAAVERRWSVSTRLHILAWGDVRGR